jgi:hypothetical protein
VVNLAVVRERLRAYYGTPVPLSIARFVVWLAADPAHVELLATSAYLTPTWDLSIADDEAPLPARPTMRYGSEPPEFMAIAGTGNDGERIGVLELAPELERDELPFVTFFPAAFHQEVCALGTEFAAALAMYLAYPSLQGPEPLRLSGLADGDAPAAVWNEFLPHSETPPGYRFMQTLDRAGVLAPVDAFGPVMPPHRQPHDWSGNDAAAEFAERALRDGYPATAIAAARDVLYVCGGRYEPAADRAGATWISAAEQLGRPWHAQMVAEVLQGYERNPAPVTYTQSVSFVDDA